MGLQDCSSEHWRFEPGQMLYIARILGINCQSLCLARSSWETILLD